MAEQYPLPDDSVSAGVNVRQVLWSGLAMLIIIAVIVAAVFLAGATLVAIKPAPTALPPPSSPAVTAPLPQLQPDPRADRQAFEAEKQAVLNSYGWIDRQAGIAHVPIEQAMELTSATGSKTSTTSEPLVVTEPAAEVAAPESSSAGSETITVKPGEYLYSIAKRIYGDASKWRLIYDANRDQLSDPDAVRVGMKLVVPAAN